MASRFPSSCDKGVGGKVSPAADAAVGAFVAAIVTGNGKVGVDVLFGRVWVGGSNSDVAIGTEVESLVGASVAAGVNPGVLRGAAEVRSGLTAPGSLVRSGPWPLTVGEQPMISPVSNNIIKDSGCFIDVGIPSAAQNVL